MKASKLDRKQDRRIAFLLPFLRLWMWFDSKRLIRSHGVNFRRKEPYILLANHTNSFDVVHIPMTFRKVPFIITNEVLLTSKGMRFLLTKIAHVIPKSKGKSDMAAVLEMMRVIERGYPVLIFPEGDRTFYGETGKIDTAIMKFIKKMEIDVITCRVTRGYLSQPRWALKKRKNRQIKMEFEQAISKDQIATLSVEEINDIVQEKLYCNAYEEQKKEMISYPGKQLALGLENVAYICPHCEAVNSIRSQKNVFWCSACQRKGRIDEYGFLHGFRYDNLVDWNHYLLSQQPLLKNTKLVGDGVLYYADIKRKKQNKIGPVTVVYDQDKLVFTNALEETLLLKYIDSPTMVFKQTLSFVYQERYFLIKFSHFGPSILRAIQDRY